MSQVSDVSLANQGFSAFRTELNNILGALNTSHIGSSAPASLAAGSIWVDTSGGATAYVLKFYDGSDHIQLGTINTTANTVDWTDSSVTFDIVNDTSPQLGGDLDVNGNAFVSTSNGNITFTPNGTGKIVFNDLAYYPEVAITSSSNAVAWDSQAAPNAKHTTTENTTFSAPSNAQTGAFISLNIQYGGSHTIAWNTVFEFSASTAPTATSTSGKSDQFVFRYNGTVWQEVGRSLNMSAT
jgi:hypothetical protein